MIVAVLSDIHGNHYALEKVLADAKKNMVEKILVLGDIVGYYYYPEKAMELLEQWDYEFIIGNHEKILKQILSDETQKRVIREKYGSGHELAIERLTEGQINKLISAPEKKTICIDNTNFLMCHGSNFDPDFYLYPDTAVNILRKCDEADIDFVLTGHSHHSFSYRNINSTLINAGSVGQSRNFGGHAEWVLINTENKSYRFKSTPYNTTALIDQVRKVNPELPYLAEILTRNN